MKLITVLILMMALSLLPGIGGSSRPASPGAEALPIGTVRIDIDIWLSEAPVACEIASRLNVKPISFEAVERGRHYRFVVNGYDFEELWAADLTDSERERLSQRIRGAIREFWRRDNLRFKSGFPIAL